MMPPRLAQRLLTAVIPERDRDTIAGDLAESFVKRGTRPYRAALGYWFDALTICLWYTIGGRGRRVGWSRRWRGRAGWLDGWGQDAVNAVRQAKKRPIVTVVAVTTLALGIGGTTVMFAVVDAVLLRPLPYPDAERLFVVERLLGTGRSLSHSEPDFLDLRERNETFEGFAALSGWTVTLAGDGAPEELSAGWVSADFLPLLGVAPSLGRHFTAEEDVEGGPDAVIISYGLWQRRFGGAPSVIGQRMQIDGTAHTVVGVMPRDFRAYVPTTFRVTTPFDLWMPLEATPDRFPRSARFLVVLGRLRSDATPTEGHGELARFSSDIRDRFEDRSRQNYRLQLIPLHEAVIAGREGPVAMVFSAVALVLLIASGNVANLLLARTTERRRELETRAALGAGRLRLVRLMLLEGAGLAMVGGVLGVGLAWVSVAYILPRVPVDLPRLANAVIDVRVVAFSMAVSSAAILLCAGWPAWRAGNVGRVGSGLRTVGSRDSRRAHRLLAAVEVALALVLLTGGAVLFRSMAAMHDVDPGFGADSVLTFRLGLPGGEAGTSSVPPAAFFDRVVRRLADLPGVAAAGGTTALPLSGRGMSIRYYEDDSDEDGRFADFHVVTPGYLEAIGARLLAGRFIDPTDRDDGRRVVMVDQRLASRVWPGASAIGRTVRLFSVTSLEPFAMERTEAEVIGVIHPLLNHDPREEQVAQVYAPHDQLPFEALSLVVRWREGGRPTPATLEEIVHGIDATLPVADVRPLTSYVEGTFSTTRFVSALLSGLALLATLLAAIGVYGVLSYLMAQRTRELGLRLALGATGRDLAWHVVREGMVPAAGGAAVGVALAAASSRLLAGLVYQVRPFDLVSVGVVTIGLLAIGFIASIVPARRAGRTDPLLALRE